MTFIVSKSLEESKRSAMALQHFDFIRKQIVGAIQENYNLEGEVMFTRLPTDDNVTDLFTGYFMGSFGPHGPELLHLSRRTDKATGMDVVQALKITGDKHVPAGEVSFQYALIV